MSEQRQDAMSRVLFSLRDVKVFAEGICERYKEAKPEEKTDEARLLYLVASGYLISNWRDARV